MNSIETPLLPSDAPIDYYHSLSIPPPPAAPCNYEAAKTKDNKISATLSNQQQQQHPPMKNLYGLSPYSQPSIHPLIGTLCGGILGLEGGIGVGKSTLGRALAKQLSANGLETRFYAETVNKAHLELFLKNPKAEAFGFQLHTLLQRVVAITEAYHWVAMGHRCAVLERTMLGNTCFYELHCAAENITESQKKVYATVLKAHSDKLLAIRQQYARHPACTAPTEMLVHVDVAPSVAFERMQKRNRPGESESYTLGYFEDLYAMLTAMLAAEKQRGSISATLDWNNPVELLPPSTSGTPLSPSGSTTTTTSVDQEILYEVPHQVIFGCIQSLVMQRTEMMFAAHTKTMSAEHQ